MEILYGFRKDLHNIDKPVIFFNDFFLSKYVCFEMSKRLALSKKLD